MDRKSQLDEDDEDDEEDEEDEEERTRRRRRRRRRRTRRQAGRQEEEATDIKSNNPHLAGGEKYFCFKDDSLFATVGHGPK